MNHSQLEKQIAIAFEGAIRCERLDIAEHLLDALQLLDLAPASAGQLAGAYLYFADRIPYLDLPYPRTGRAGRYRRKLPV